MNDDVGLYCKSFAADFLYLGYLLESFARHNPDDLQLTLSLPGKDVTAFHDRFGAAIGNVRVVQDESYCGHDLTRYPGWYGQQICKLTSWKAVEAEHYAVLDSDCYFIADINATRIRPRPGARFVACGSSIRTVLKEGNQTLIDYMASEGEIDVRCLPQRPSQIVDRLAAFIGHKDLDRNNPGAEARSDIPFNAFGSQRWLYYQPGQFFSRGLLQRLCALFAQHGLSAGDAILICPWEYNWYGEYAATHGFEDTHFSVSPFIHFQDEEGMAFARKLGVTQDTLRGKFIWIQMASRHIKKLSF